MIDNKKIEEAARHNADKYRNYPTLSDEDRDKVSIGSFRDGAKWAINELKDSFHPASEVPRNDNGKVLAFSKEHGYRKLYDMNDMLDETDCYTYQDMWENEVNKYCLTDWIFVDELYELITKGGKNERA